MNTASKVGLAVGIPALAFGIYKGVTLFKKSDAAGKLVLNLDDVSLEGADKKGVKIKVKFSAKNPSDQELGFENLYVKISLPDSKGVLSKVADTIPDPTGTKIPAGQIAKAEKIGEVRFLDLLTVSPDIAIYLGGRAKGAKATRDAKVEWTYKSEGFNLNDFKVIKL